MVLPFNIWTYLVVFLKTLLMLSVAAIQTNYGRSLWNHLFEDTVLVVALKIISSGIVKGLIERLLLSNRNNVDSEQLKLVDQ